MEDEAASPSWQFRRVPAVARAVDDDLVVCAVGWDTPVHVLAGAARVVWDATQTAGNRESVAAQVGVDVDDPYLVTALELLCGSGLLVPVDRV